MSVKEDLIAAKALIDTPEKHRDRQFGVLGALSDVLPEEDGVPDDDSRFDAMRAALLAHRGGNLVGINNERHADIMALFDRAIEAQP